MNCKFKSAVIIVSILLIAGCAKKSVYCDNTPNCCVIETSGGGRVTACKNSIGACNALAIGLKGSILEYPLNVNALDLTGAEKEAQYGGCKTGEETDDDWFSVKYSGSYASFKRVPIHLTQAVLRKSGSLDCEDICTRQPESCIDLSFSNETTDEGMVTLESSLETDVVKLTLDDIKKMYNVSSLNNCGFKEIDKSQEKATIVFDSKCTMEGQIDFLDEIVPVTIVGEGEIPMKFKSVGKVDDAFVYNTFFSDETKRFVFLFPDKKHATLNSSHGGEIANVARNSKKRFKGLSSGTCYSYK